jgi:hypothetical protein
VKAILSKISPKTNPLQPFSVIQDLITEVTSTKEAIDDATRGVEESLQRVKLQSVPPPLPQTNSLEGDLFGFDAAPTSVPAREETAVPEPPSRYESPQYTAPQEPMQPQGHQDSLIQTVPSQASYDDSINGHHKRDNSSGWFSGGIMGGEFGGAMGQTASASFSLNASTGNVLSPQAINELKAKHREAENIARDAEESRRQIAAQTDELRRLADEAEKNLREYSKETDDKKKKKGMFGSGRGKKKDEVGFADQILFYVLNTVSDVRNIIVCRNMLAIYQKMPERRRKRLFRHNHS